MRFTPSGTQQHGLMRLPLVALIDVVLFLLFYFMVAGTLSAEESELSTTLGTDGKGRLVSGDLQPQIVQLRMQNGRAVYAIGDRAVDTAAGLSALLAQLPREAGVLVRAAGDVPVGDSAAAIQACKDVGFVKVTYVPGK